MTVSGSLTEGIYNLVGGQTKHKIKHINLVWYEPIQETIPESKVVGGLTEV